MKSKNSSFGILNSLESAGLIYEGFADRKRHSAISQILAIVVAKAAPLASILGTPKSPKINKALKAMFRKRRCKTPGFIILLWPPLVNAIPKGIVHKIWLKICKTENEKK
jgi:hypothetical protein